EMDSTTPGRTVVTMRPPRSDTFVLGEGDQETKLAQLAQSREITEGIMRLFGGEVDRDLTTAEVVDSLNVKPEVVYDAWKLLETEGTVIRLGSTMWTRFRLKP